MIGKQLNRVPTLSAEYQNFYEEKKIKARYNRAIVNGEGLKKKENSGV